MNGHQVKHVVLPWTLTIVAMVLLTLTAGPAAGTASADLAHEGTSFAPNSSPALAAVNVPCDAGALIRAIDAANSNEEADTLNLAANCTYVLTTMNNVNDGVNGLPSITSEILIYGNRATIERSDATGTLNFRIFHVSETGNLALYDLSVCNGRAWVDFPGRLDGGGIFNRGMLALSYVTIRDNSGNKGGGILNDGGNVTLSDGSVVNHNDATYGGGIYNAGGTLELNASSVNGNTAGDGGGGGGGIYNESGELTLSDSSISANTVGNGADGGGIFNQAGTVTLTGSTVRYNWSSTYYNTLRGYGRGGGIYNDTGALTLINSVVSHNPASGGGGGVYNRAGTLTLGRNIIKANSTNSYPGSVGGGIYNGGTLTLVNNTISENTAQGGSTPSRPGRGGGVCNDGTMILINNTISDNAAKNYNRGSYGGGIYNNGTATLTNNIVSDNSVDYYYDEDDDILYGGGANCAGDITSGGHNLDSGDTCGLTAPGDLSDTDPRLGPLQDNGGSTETYALLPGSPAIDGGDDAACPDTDQRGAPRPMDGDGDGNAICDIGAYELQFPITILNIRAFIDGRSHLVVQGDTVYWHHLDFAAPGRHPDAPGGNAPTYLNGTTWCPGWPGDPPDLEPCAPVDNESRDCDCDSTSFAGIPVLAAQPQTVALDIIQARANVNIVQQPDADNGFTLIVEFDDIGPGGPDWYEINLTYQEEPTAITLLSFTAQPSADHVTLTWETGSEVDNAGFNVWRAETADGPYARLNDALIPAQGDPFSGASYSYTDSDVVQGGTLYYKLEDVDTHGVSTLYGPVSARPSPIRQVYLPLILE